MRSGDVVVTLRTAEYMGAAASPFTPLPFFSRLFSVSLLLYWVLLLSQGHFSCFVVAR
jgi:hypothetical protein